MRQFLNIFALCLMLFAIVFAVSNRFIVPLGFWPFPFSLDTPLFLIAFCFFLIGFILGWLNYWVHARPKLHAEIKDLRERLHYLKEHSVLQASDDTKDS